MASAVVAVRGAVSTAAAAQKDDDQNDPQAPAVVTVAPHIFHLALKSKPYYDGTTKK